MRIDRVFVAGWAAMAGILVFGASEAQTIMRAPDVVADTVTYSDQRIVYTVATDTATLNGQLRRLPILTAAPAGARFRVFWKQPLYDSVMLLTGDTFAMSPTDSATAKARARAWGVPDPYVIRLTWHDPQGIPPPVPAPVTNITLVMNVDTLTSDWTESADDYQVTGGLNAGGDGENYGDSTTAPPYQRVVATFGSYWTCVRAYNVFGVSDSRCLSATYSDTAPAPPAPDTTAHPNEPAGFIRFAEFNFDGRPGTATPDDGEWTERASTASRLTIIESLDQLPDSTSDSVARLKFPSGGGDGVSYTRFDGWGPTINESGGNPYDELYVSFWMKIEGSDFENQTVGTKVFYIAYGSNIRTNHSTMFLGGAGFASVMSQMTPLYFIYEMEADGSDAGGGSVARWPNTGSSKKIVPGGWQHIEAYFKINDIGPTTDNGVYMMWIDGERTHNHTGLRWRSDENPLGFYHMQFTPVWGGSSGDVRTRDDYWQIDKIYMSSQ